MSALAKHRWCTACQRMQLAVYGPGFPACAVCGGCCCVGCVSRWGEHSEGDDSYRAQRDAEDAADRKAWLRRRRA